MNYSMKIEDLLEKIRYLGDSYPTNELNEIIARKEEAIPVLMKILKQVSSNPKGFQEPGRMDYLYAIMLLAQFQIKEGFYPFLDTLRLPNDLALELYKEFFNKDTGRIIASMYSGEEIWKDGIVQHPELDAILELINDSTLDVYIRAAGFDAIENLVLQNRLPKEIVQYYYHDLLQENLNDDTGLLCNELILSCIQLDFPEMLDDIKDAFETRRIVPAFLSLEDVEAYFNSEDKEIYLNDCSPITDIHLEIPDWPCYSKSSSIVIK